MPSKLGVAISADRFGTLPMVSRVKICMVLIAGYNPLAEMYVSFLLLQKHRTNILVNKKRLHSFVGMPGQSFIRQPSLGRPQVTSCAQDSDRLLSLQGKR